MKPLLKNSLKKEMSELEPVPATENDGYISQTLVNKEL